MVIFFWGVGGGRGVGRGKQGLQAEAVKGGVQAGSGEFHHVDCTPVWPGPLPLWSGCSGGESDMGCQCCPLLSAKVPDPVAVLELLRF